ncbi:hypothetical protein MTO96_021502 [Rhipicephalus appendiculatus]
MKKCGDPLSPPFIARVAALLATQPHAPVSEEETKIARINLPATGDKARRTAVLMFAAPSTLYIVAGDASVAAVYAAIELTGWPNTNETLRASSTKKHFIQNRAARVCHW